jgi:hypothetical protein
MAGLLPACDHGIAPPSGSAADGVSAAETVQRLCLRDVLGDFVCGNEEFTTWEDWLQIREDGTYTRNHYSSCTGPSDQAGSVDIDGEYVVLRGPPSAALIGGRLVHLDLDTRLRVVRWDERTYLVMDGQVDYFCKLINEGREPRRSRLGTVIFLRSGDEQLEAKGRPRPWNVFRGA